MRILVFFCLGLSFVAASKKKDYSEFDLDEWNKFKATHRKLYSSSVEESTRRNIFVDNLRFIEEHNKKFENGEFTFKVGINEFADMTTEEFNTKMNGFRKSPFEQKTGIPFVMPKNEAVHSKINWKSKGAVTGVKNQGSCGSCWAFSSTGSLEAQHFLKTGKLVSLSEQNLIDCSLTDGNHACYGGWVDKAFSSVVRIGGIDSEKSYPYTETTTWSCHYNASNSAATAKGHVDIPWGSENSLMAAVSSVGPVSVAIDSSLKTFHLYRSGVFNDQSCSKTKLNHAVLVVGYDRTWWSPFKKRQDYWLVKNSWGRSWGEFGYVRMARNASNLCGIANEASYPLV